eukprot:EG_transcript_5708
MALSGLSVSGLPLASAGPEGFPSAAAEAPTLHPVQRLPSSWKPKRPSTTPPAMRAAIAPTRAKSASVRHHNFRQRTTVSLEEVLLQKMALEEQKFALPQAAPTTRSPDGSPGKPKGGTRTHAWVQEARDRVRLLQGERIYEKPASKFAKAVDLPALGLALRSDTLEQDFSFAVQPERERAFLSTELEKERRVLRLARETPEGEQRLHSFEQLPPPVLASEPFLQFLADKVREEVKEAQAWRLQHGREAAAKVSPAPVADPSTLLDRPPSQDRMAAVGRGHPPSPTTSDASPVPLAQPSQEGDSPKMQYYGRRLPRAVSAAVRRPASPATTPQRPHTAGAPLTRLFKDAKSKQEAMRGLLSRREQQEAQLSRLELQEEELQALRQRLERLLEDEENEILRPELGAQLAALEDQRLHLHHLRKALGTPPLPSAVAGRQEHLRHTQEAAWRLLLDSMAQHEQAEALAQARAQQRSQRTTQMLWQRRRLNRKPDEDAPGSSPPASPWATVITTVPSPGRTPPTPTTPPSAR